jgi:CDP-diacylglycerol--glycerol-3-phosphate 3-phosphatidyltransferase
MNLANKLTILRLILIPVFYIFLTPFPLWLSSKVQWIDISYSMSIYVATSIFIFAAITDKLDGYIARRYNQVTEFGKLFDPLADKLMITAAIIALVDLNLIPAWIAIIIVGREFMVTLIRIMASGRGVDLSADGYGKIKMVLQVAAIIVVLLHNQIIIHIIKFPIDLTLMLLAVIVTLLSGLNYIIKNSKVLFSS